jgi:hypothetical protein
MVAAAWTGCGPRAQETEGAASEDAVVVARVADQVVLTTELGEAGPPEEMSRRLDGLVDRKVAAIEARRRGLDRDPYNRATIESFYRGARAREEMLLRNALYNSIRLGLEVDEEALQAHYERTKQRYRGPIWTLRTRRFASEAEAHETAARLGSSGRLEAATSETVGPLPPELMPAPIRAAMPAIETSQGRLVYQLDGAWSVIEVVDVAPNGLLPLEAVRDKVEASWRAVRAEELLREEIARARAQLGVEIDEAVLADLQPPAETEAPAPSEPAAEPAAPAERAAP